MRNIFKIYGFTVSAVVLSRSRNYDWSDLSTLTRSLKSVAKSVGDGLKTLGSKIAGIMLRLIGLMVGFIFKTSGSVISFLDRKTWLLGPG